MDFDPAELNYPLRMEWVGEETEVFDDMVEFVSNVEFLDGMVDDPEFKLFDADGRRLYMVLHGCDIKRVSFAPDADHDSGAPGSRWRLWIGWCLLAGALIAWCLWWDQLANA